MIVSTTDSYSRKVSNPLSEQKVPEFYILFYYLTHSAVTHAYDIQTATDTVLPLSSYVIDSVYCNFLSDSVVINVSSSNW